MLRVFLASDFDGPHQPFKGDPDQPLFAAGYPFFPVRAPKNGSFSSSHLLVGAEGTNRKHVLINYGRGFFIREKRFRLNQDGNLYDIPITSDASRYSEAIATDPAHAADRTRLTKTLDNFMAIESQYNKSSSNDRKKRERQN